MSIDSILSGSRDKSSAFSPFLVASASSSSEKVPFSSGISTTAPTFGCFKSPQHSSYPYLYPSVIGPAYTQRYLGQEHGIVPLLDPKGVIQHIGPYLHHSASIPGMFSYHPIEDEKPSQSYIGLIGKAILSTPQEKLVLSDIYNYILTNYPYFRNKGPGWRNSIRHNLSLNECFIKVGRSPNGKGHFWTINPLNYEDFSKGEYRRKRANKKRSDGENIKLKNTEKEKDVVSKTEAKVDYIKSGVPLTSSKLFSGIYGTYSASSIPNKTTSIKENKGFHIETILSGLKDHNSLSSCLKRKCSQNNGVKADFKSNTL
ncbi:forkhead box protein I2-like [Actinia tenebrosa]|uniref:Forkhead box protein I2-like n=1 Tax=Actinia tenebrosa TaxID=6105 RepID=A0A6P8ITB6_ACTTE|nr:forkhead box protein I2-like [Actinia tenebrosa]